MNLTGMSEHERQEVIKKAGLFRPRAETMWVKMGWSPTISRPDPFAWRDKVTASKTQRLRPRD